MRKDWDAIIIGFAVIFAIFLIFKVSGSVYNAEQKRIARIEQKQKALLAKLEKNSGSLTSSKTSAEKIREYQETQDSEIRPIVDEYYKMVDGMKNRNDRRSKEISERAQAGLKQVEAIREATARLIEEKRADTDPDLVRQRIENFVTETKEKQDDFFRDFQQIASDAEAKRQANDDVERMQREQRERMDDIKRQRDQMMDDLKRKSEQRSR